MKSATEIRRVGRHRYAQVPWDRWRKNLARRLAKRRKQHGFSLQSFAQAVAEQDEGGTDAPTVCRWENAEVIPILESLFRIARALRIDIKSLVPVTYRRVQPKRRRKKKSTDGNETGPRP